MKKTLLLPIIAAGALFLGACGGDNPASSSVVPDPSSSSPAGTSSSQAETSSTPAPGTSSTGETSSSVAPRTDIYSSTADNPFSPEEFAGILAADANESTTNYTEGTVYLRGKVISSSYNSNHSSYNIYLEAGDYTVEIYSGKMSDSFEHDAAWQESNGLVGATVQAQGYAVDFISGSNHTYEIGYISSIENSNPTITSVEFAADYFSLDKSAVSVAVGGSDTVTAAFLDTTHSGSVTFVSDKPEIASVSVSGLVCTVNGVAAGTATITATGDLGSSKTIRVTVTDPSESALASYDFTANTETASGAATAEQLLAHFGTYSTGASNIVSAISETSRVYLGYSYTPSGGTATSYTYLGLKFGSSKAAGSFTFTTSTAVSKIVVTAAAWNASQDLTIGGVTYSDFSKNYYDEGSLEERTFEFASTTSVTVTWANRGFLATMALYA